MKNFYKLYSNSGASTTQDDEQIDNEHENTPQVGEQLTNLIFEIPWGHRKLLRKEGRDNPTIGLLISKQKDNLMAQYALEGTNLPVGISEYELAKLYPDKVEGKIPTIEEIEKKLK